MPISDVAALFGGAALGAPFSEILKLAIEEAKKVKDFKPLSRDLVSTMERLVPVCMEIELMLQGSITGKNEVMVLMKTVQRAEEIARKCSRVQWYNIIKRASYTRKIKGINHDLFRFCKIELQLIQYRNQLHNMRSMAGLTTKIDLLSITATERPELFLVPQPKEVTVSWLEPPLRELKKKLFEDGVVTVVVCAPSTCGKTTLVTKLCHDADVKGKFKQILFITVSKSPNIRLTLHKLLEHTGCNANEFVKNFDSRRCILQLLMRLKQSGSILLVLDDVWPEEKSLLEMFLIQLPDFKILVTSRFEFPNFGPTFHLEPLIDEAVKNLFIECAPQPNCQSCAKFDHSRQKILKRCNGLPLALNPPCSICGGCNFVIEDERFVNVLGVLWHTGCFACDACHKPIAIHEVEDHVSYSRSKFHKSCYKELRNSNCYVCKEKIPLTVHGIKYNMHPFWMMKYCPSHEVDGTPKCCGCERLKPRGTNYEMFCDGRWLCLECMKTSVMDIVESHSLHFDIREFFEGLNMKVEQDFPVILVEKQTLNKAVTEDETDQHHEMLTKAICLSEELVMRGVSRRPRRGPGRIGDLLDDMITESVVVRECTVTAILIICGLPRLLTGYTLAHEMMHAWLRLNGYTNLIRGDLEEGICQVLGHMWLESQTNATTDATAAEASSSRSPPAAAATSKKDEYSDFEKKLLKFCKYQIETDESVFGVGFRKVKEMMVSNNYNLEETLKEIVSASNTKPRSKF